MEKTIEIPEGYKALRDNYKKCNSRWKPGEEVMTMCNQILIDWVKEGKTQEEREQREQAHIRFFELYDEYMQEQPEVDFETEYAKFSNDPDALDYAFPIDLADYKDFARHFYELGLNARKEE